MPERFPLPQRPSRPSGPPIPPRFGARKEAHTKRRYCQLEHAIATAVAIACLAGCASGPRRGAFEGSEESLRAGEEYVRQKLEDARHGEIDRTFMSFLELQTLLKMWSGEWNVAVHTAEPLAEMAEIVYGPESSEYANVLVALGDIYWKLNRLPEAAATLERSVAITRTLQAERPVDHICVLNRLGAIYNLLARPRDAERYLLEALEFAEERFGPNSGEIYVISWLLVGSYAGQGKAEASAAFRERAERIAKLKAKSHGRGC